MHFVIMIIIITVREKTGYNIFCKKVVTVQPSNQIK